MPKQPYLFTDTALLVTHYNRPQSLKRLLDAFSNLGISFSEIVVSDDGSREEHIQLLRTWQTSYSYTLVESPVNKGLGNNINKGQQAVQAPFTLYVQEDFIPKENFAGNLSLGLELIKKDLLLDLVRYYAYFPYPYTRPYDNQFKQLVFHWYYPGYMKFYQYSDHPHLRRSDFLNKFGPYKEGVNGDQTEYAMCLAFLKKKGKAIMYKDINTNFDQLNDTAEPSTATFRKDWKNSNSFLVKLLRWFYLQIKTCKYHLDYFIIK